MTGSRTYFRRIVRQPEECYDDGEPVSTLRAFVMRNNAQFLLEQQCQHRINFVQPNGNPETPLGQYTFVVDNTAASALFLTRYWNQPFHHTWLQPDRPVSLDILVNALSGDTDGSLSIEAKIVPASTPPNDPSIPGVWSATASTTSVDTQITIDTQVAFTSPVDQAGIFFTQQVLESDNFYRTPRFALMRFELAMTVAADDYGQLQSVLVREYFT